METRHTQIRQTAQNRQIVLKRDTFGTVYVDSDSARVIRDVADVHWLARPLARHLARREAATLAHLAGSLNCPELIELTSERLARTFLPGQAMHTTTFEPRAYFRDALRQLRRMHATGVAHNDLAKEANWLCLPGDRAAIIDFQVAVISRRRGRLFRTLAREDLRHLLKHKAHYAAASLSARQRAILARPSWLTMLWRKGFKPVYHFITRRLLGWPERDSAIERTH